MRHLRWFATNRYHIFPISDECEHLATTIGQVIQEATAKCEHDIEQRHARHAETVRTLETHIAQLNTSMECECRRAAAAAARIEQLDERLAMAMQQNARLDGELEAASRTIVSER